VDALRDLGGSTMSRGRSEMQLSLQSSLLSVADLDRSIEFYREMLDLRLVSRSDRIAALLITETVRRQVLVLREVQSRYPTHPGSGSIGLRLLALESGSLAELEAIEQRLVGRQAFVRRHRTETWEAVIGVDPDRIEVSVAASLTGPAIQTEDWSHLDQMIYTVGV
jgi:catechol 2,3-dioxygenase-like lactoylglutathione lyase family enzyme